MRAAVDCRQMDHGDLGEETGGKCLWRKAEQPWKLGDAAESHAVGGAITIASLPTSQHQQLNNREAGCQMPDTLNYRAESHPGCSFK